MPHPQGLFYTSMVMRPSTRYPQRSPATPPPCPEPHAPWRDGPTRTPDRDARPRVLGAVAYSRARLRPRAAPSAPEPLRTPLWRASRPHRCSRRRQAARQQPARACEAHSGESAPSMGRRASEAHLARKPDRRDELVDAGSDDPRSREDMHLHHPRQKPGGALRQDHFMLGQVQHYSRECTATGPSQRHRCGRSRRSAASWENSPRRWHLSTKAAWTNGGHHAGRLRATLLPR